MERFYAWAQMGNDAIGQIQGLEEQYFGAKTGLAGSQPGRDV
jgi:hypothetical protein